MRYLQILLGSGVSALVISCQPVVSNPPSSPLNTPSHSGISSVTVRTPSSSPTVQESSQPTNVLPIPHSPIPSSPSPKPSNIPPIPSGPNDLIAKVETYLACNETFLTPDNQKVILDKIGLFSITPDQKFIYLYNHGNIYKIQRGNIDPNQVPFYHIHDIIATYKVNSERIRWLTANNTELYFTDGNQVKKITSSGNVQIVAGQMDGGYQDGPSSAALFNSLIGIALDAQNNIYVVDNENSAIRKISAQTHEVTTLVGPGLPGSGIAPDGPAAKTFVNDAYGIAVNPTGTMVFVAESGAIRIRVIESQQVRTLAGSGMSGFQDGPGNLAKFRSPDFIQLSRFQTLYVADLYGNLLREISPDGTVRTIAGNPKLDRENCAEGLDCGRIGYGPDARFDGPSYLSQDSQGNLYLVSGRCAILKVSFVPASIAPAAASATQSGIGY